ncbi:hypothetical protein HI914_06559 [Erysiphe necator]|nr:hypothetical protein HI914_06559 [Erysiphe necator]
MQTKNVFFTREGIKVGIKELKNEKYVDLSQNFLVKTWNSGSWPGYTPRLKINLWRKEETTVKRRPSASP